MLQTSEDSLKLLAAARELRECAEQIEIEAVMAARRDGRSWSRIGAVYGLTKQGAQQRFGATSSAPEDPAGGTGSRRRRKMKEAPDPPEVAGLES